MTTLYSSIGCYKESTSSLPMEDNPIVESYNIQDLDNVYISDNEQESNIPVNNNIVVELSKIESINNTNASNDNKDSSLPIQDNPVLQLSKIQDSVSVDKCEKITEEPIQQFVREIKEIKSNIYSVKEQNKNLEKIIYDLINYLEITKSNIKDVKDNGLNLKNKIQSFLDTGNIYLPYIEDLSIRIQELDNKVGSYNSFSDEMQRIHSDINSCQFFYEEYKFLIKKSIQNLIYSFENDINYTKGIKLIIKNNQLIVKELKNILEKMDQIYIRLGN